MYELPGKRIWVAGHTGLVGSALVRRLEREGCDILLAGRDRADLTRQSEVEALVRDLAPDAIVVAAAKVGGILANSTHPVEFLYDNLMIQTNIIDAAHKCDVNRMLLLGSSCIYPKFANQPIQEGSLLAGPLEPTNEWYAIAKIAGIKTAQAYRTQYKRDYISAMPTNLYGPGDNFDLASSHVLPALLRKTHEAKVNGEDKIIIWGSGSPRREFLHVDDCADALVHMLKFYSEMEHINVGSGYDVSIKELAQTVAEAVGFQGRIERDLSKPDGTPRKLMSSEKLHALGWTPSIALDDGIRSTYNWFLENVA